MANRTKDLAFYKSLPYTRRVSLVEEDFGETYYLAEVAELDGVEASGNDPQEALFHLQEAFEEYLETWSTGLPRRSRWYHRAFRESRRKRRGRNGRRRRRFKPHRRRSALAGDNGGRCGDVTASSESPGPVWGEMWFSGRFLGRVRGLRESSLSASGSPMSQPCLARRKSPAKGPPKPAAWISRPTAGD
jgi:predicted RNase H-like HicB family nuclease